jgi:hypothetical protein
MPGPMSPCDALVGAVSCLSRPGRPRSRRAWPAISTARRLNAARLRVSSVRLGEGGSCDPGVCDDSLVIEPFEGSGEANVDPPSCARTCAGRHDTGSGRSVRCSRRRSARSLKELDDASRNAAAVFGAHPVSRWEPVHLHVSELPQLSELRPARRLCRGRLRRRGLTPTPQVAAAA